MLTKSSKTFVKLIFHKSILCSGIITGVKIVRHWDLIVSKSSSIFQVSISNNNEKGAMIDFYTIQTA